MAFSRARVFQPLRPRAQAIRRAVRHIRFALEPPAPMGARISYGPSLSPSCNGIGLMQYSLADREMHYS